MRTMKPNETKVSTGFLNRLQTNDHFWKWIKKYGTQLSVHSFIRKVEEDLNDEILSSKRKDVKANRVKNKTIILMFFNKNKNNLESYFKDYNNAKHN
jgi:desulfoferrodoxin (superoxide reductase-like protein)